MKKILSLFILSCIPVFAEEGANTIYLNLKAGEEHEYKTFNPKIESINIKNDDKEDEDYIYHPTEYIKNEFKNLFFNKQKED